MQTQTEQLLSTTQTLKLVSSTLLEKVAELMKVKKMHCHLSQEVK